MTAPFRRKTEAEDWARYGLGHRDIGADGLPTSTPGHVQAALDDPYRDYRYEDVGGRTRRSSEDRARSRRRQANRIGVAAAIGALVVAAFLLNLRASSVTPDATPSPYLAITTTAQPSATIAPTLRMAHVGVQAQLPFSPILPDRDSTPDDGKNIFLAGDAGAVEIDPGSGAIAGVFGGAGYPTKVRRTVFDSGLWLSSWTGNGLCGPDCWSGATTYRVDPQTAAISLKFNATYLIGSSFEGVWVATGQNVELLDPTTGDVLATTPWFTGGEPRVGCGSLWSFNQDSKNSLLFLVGNNTGAATGPARLDMAVDYGPIAVEGQCWAMSGSGGASSGPSKLVWLNPDGSVFDTRQSADSVVVLAGEFWQYRADGTIQRLEASSSVNYGTRFQLPLEPAGGDVGELFSAVGYVWLSEGDQLIAFDIRTGAAASAD